jgi:hypothetical protein
VEWLKLMTPVRLRRESGPIRAASAAAAFVLAVAIAPATRAQVTIPTPENFTVAFFGDQGLDDSSVAVLELVLQEGAEAVVHLGDFDYLEDPAGPALWEAQINATLGPDFPYFASAGNHDKDFFQGPGGYQEYLAARMGRLGIVWDGDLGTQSSFEFGGIFFVLTAPHDFGEGDGFHDLYIRDQLAASPHLWKVSGWHRNMTAMQVGGKEDDVGWGVYEESRRGGAIVATAHEHSYSRTHLLSSFSTQTVASTESPLALAADDPGTPEDEGRSFAFVSGLGGRGIRPQLLDGPWWANVYTSDDDARHGALFGVFNYEGNPRLARFYLKTVDGQVVDDFLVENHLFVPEPSAPFLEVAALALLVGLRWLARRRPRAHAEALSPA